MDKTENQNLEFKVFLPDSIEVSLIIHVSVMKHLGIN